MATGFMSGGAAVKGAETLGLMEMAAFFDAFVVSIMKRGKAKPGEKTVVDVLHPAAKALKEASDSGLDLASAFAACRTAAEEGLERSRDMVGLRGRVAYYQQNSKGKEDPGAVAGRYLIHGFADVICAE